MEYGKFETLDELVKGYNQLEKSFTQKCQQLSESQRENAALSQQLAQTQPPLGTNEASSPSIDDSGNVDTARSTTVDSVASVPQDVGADVLPTPCDPAPAQAASPTNDQLQQYLLDNPQIAQKLLHAVQKEFAPAVMSGGGNVTLTPPNRPKTIKEASLMAKELFKN